MSDAVSESFATELRCLRCGEAAAASGSAYLCPLCGEGDGGDPGILDVAYDYGAARHALRDSLRAPTGGIFRWLPVLPLGAPAPVLPAGATPLVAAPRLAERLGLRALYLKDETRNPTRCLKDRATAVGVSIAARQGFRDLYCASAGNAAISLAGFCAHAGLACRVFVPSYASRVRLAWLERFGAEVHVSKGDYDDAFREAEERGRSEGWYSRNCAYNPYLVEGKKTAAYEIAEALDWQVPDAVAAPVGDGCTLGAIGKGFRELQAMGLTGSVPRLVGVQAEAVAPLVARWESGEETAASRTWPRGRPEASAAGDAASPNPSRATEPGRADPHTRAHSIAVRRPRNAIRALGEVRASGGTWVGVADREIEGAALRVAREAGIACELSAAAGVAGLFRLAALGRLRSSVAVAVITGGRVDEA